MLISPYIYSSFKLKDILGITLFISFHSLKNPIKRKEKCKQTNKTIG